MTEVVLPEQWNRWHLAVVLKWVYAHKGGVAHKWVHASEIPLLCGRGGNERHRVAWLNKTFPVEP